MKDKSYEESVEAAKPVGEIMRAAERLDVEYLTEALKDMRESHEMRDSMAVLNPNPHTHHEIQELNNAKLEQLELMIKLAKNVQNIKTKTIELQKAKSSENELRNLFGH